MKKIISFSALLLVLVLFVSSNVPHSAKKSPVSLAGTWNLAAYGYDKKGIMSMYFVENTKYVFEENFSGKIVVNDSTTAAFSWELKKKNLTLTLTGETKHYRISNHTATDLIIVDKVAGRDENRTYEAYEKGLMLKK